MISKFQLSASCLSAIAEVIRQMEIVYGRVRIQKTAYFLKRLGMAELTDVDFFYHHYGPFSWTVADSLVEGVRCHALREESKPIEDDRQAYAYRLGDDVADKVDTVSPESRTIAQRIVDRVRDEHWRTLELASTIDFLQQHEGISRDEAVSRALSLKPACHDHKEKALRLLNDLELPAA